MRATTLTLALTLFTMTASADPADEVRAAETAFAKAFADRDQAKFFSMVADDATFIGGRSTQVGKPEVVKVWSGFFKDSNAPFSWGPENVHVNAAGDLGISIGPIKDPQGKHIGNYSSIWQKHADGTWKVIFDGPGSPPPCK
jgi:ketosteroid isomerase-like protein